MQKFLYHLLRILFILLVPLVIVLGSIRLLATNPYLAFEYRKVDFPADTFGFDRTQRLAYASANIQFVTGNRPLQDLAGQNLGGAALYNNRELKHMQDVQSVYQAVWRAWKIAVFLLFLSGLLLAWRKANRSSLASAIKAGGLLTAGLVVAIGLAAVLAWQSWFTTFHQVFFAPGSWTFDFSDTLIRLFPEKFWFDIALTISALSLSAGLLLAVAGWRWQMALRNER